MIVERHVTLDALYAVVRRGPCPYCGREAEHAHKIAEVELAGIADEVVCRPVELAEIGAEAWNAA
jgi:sarcosine oxidase delta subunit